MLEGGENVFRIKMSDNTYHAVILMILFFFFSEANDNKPKAKKSATVPGGEENKTGVNQPA